jgi:hypothetical protein
VGLLVRDIKMVYFLMGSDNVGWGWSSKCFDLFSQHGYEKKKKKTTTKKRRQQFNLKKKT